MRSARLRMLGGVLLSIGGVVWLVWGLGSTPAETVLSQDTAKDRLPLPKVEKPIVLKDREKDYESVVKMNLFVPSRSNEIIRSVSENTPSGNSPPKSQKLVGVRLTSVYGIGEYNTALIERQGRRPTTVHEGDLVEGWKVIKITHEGADLVRSGQKQHLSLYDFKKPAIVRARPSIPKGKQPSQATPRSPLDRLKQSKTKK